MSYRTVSLEHLLLSDTAAQIERRKHLDKAGLNELAESIRSAGVINPILVRILGAENSTPEFEVVAGERRVLAAKSAGLTEIPAMVKDLTDQEVIELQLIENLQREGLHELAEAEGYEALQEKHGYSVDDLVVKVGKSKAYVYSRLKLLELSKEARAAFYSGGLSASSALLLARLHNADDQKRMLKVALNGQYGDGDPMSFRELKRYIGEEVMLQLKRAPFDTTTAELVPKAGPCTTCPKRSGNQVGLFEDGESEDLCTDSACFRLKREAAIKIKADAARAEGKTVLSAKEAAKIFPNQTDHAQWDASYRALDATEYAGGSSKKIRALIPKDAKTVLVPAPSGALIEMVSRATVDKAIASARAKPRQVPKSAATVQVNAEQKLLDRIFAEVIKKRPTRLAIHELRFVVEIMTTANAGLRATTPKVAKIPNLSESECHRALYDLVYDDLAEDNPKLFFKAAVRMRINVDAIRKEITPAPQASKKPTKKK
jgi:ParB/RepB/Spo0J family partition protein